METVDIAVLHWSRWPVELIAEEHPRFPGIALFAIRGFDPDADTENPAYTHLITTEWDAAKESWEMLTGCPVRTQ